MRVVVLAILLVASAARAQGQIPHTDDADLTRAKELEAKLEYDEALTLVESVIVRGHADPNLLVELHFMAGKLAAGLDRIEVAENHFAIVLSLRPATAMPEGTSPKITTPFDAARGKTAPLRISTRGTEIDVEADPLQLVSRTEFRDGQARAFDAYGNVVWSKSVELFDEHPPPPITRSPPRPFYKRPVFWGGIALGTASLAGVGAWRFDVAQNEWNEMKTTGGHEYSDLAAVEDRGRRWGLVANVGLGLALLSTIATLAFAF